MERILNKFYRVNDIYSETYTFKIPWILKKKDIDGIINEENLPNQHNTIKSAVTTKTFHNSSWYLELSHKKDFPNVLQIRLHLEKANIDRMKMMTDANFIIKADDGDYETEYIEGRDNFTKDFWLTSWFAKNEIYKDKYWQSGFLCIVCKVNVEIKDLVHSNNSEPLDEFLTRLMKNGAYSDVTIKVGTKLFKAHRNIKANRCDYFDVMFGGTFKESASSEIEMKDIEPDIFEAILLFIYSNKLPAHFATIAEDLLVVSDMLLLPALTEICENHLCQNVTMDNYFDLLLVAYHCNQKKLKKKVAYFIMKNFKVLKDKESWKVFRKNHRALTNNIRRRVNRRNRKLE